MLTSADGATWSEVTAHDAPFEQLPRLTIAALTADASRTALVVGTTAHGDADVELWSRRNGAPFASVRPTTAAVAGQQYANAAVLDGADALVAGADDATATVWRIPLR
jgi:hypothetical protein